MMLLSELARAALLGTRTAAPELPLVADPAAAKLMAALQDERAECTLLRWSALLVAAEASTMAPARPHLAAQEPVPEDPRPLLSEPAAQMLRRVLEGFQPALLYPLLIDIAKHGKRLPLALLPAILTHGSDAGHRDAARGVVCSAARWLAAKNPAWSWALGTDEHSALVFDIGLPPARLEAFRRLREQDPDDARARLEAVWKSEPPEERRDLLDAFEVGLGDGDEPFLEAALDDRRKEVRQVAVKLLCRLPASRLVARAHALAQPLMRVQRGILRKSLEVELPAECTVAMQRDGIALKSHLGSSIGDRAYWLCALLARVPPSVWCERFGMAPAQLLALTRGHELKHAVRLGLAEATANFRNYAFARAFAPPTRGFSGAPYGQHIDDFIVPVLAELPDYEAIVIQAMEQEHGLQPNELLRYIPGTFSEGLTRACLKLMRAGCHAPINFEVTGTHMLPLPEALHGWELPEDAPPYVRRALEDFLAVLEFRMHFARHLEN